MQNLIKLLIKQKVSDQHALDACLRQFLRSQKINKQMPSKKNILKVYHEMVKKNKLKVNKNLEQLLIKRAVRTLSGVTVITVLTKPYPCPGQCIYCPNEIKMPKSYISDEPAAARALMLEFDPYEQVSKRIETLRDNGHPTDKIELIIKGGSWSTYPIDYQYWFVLRCFQSCNANRITYKSNNLKPQQNNNLRQLKNRLLIEQQNNEQATHRIIGLTLETRPDMINGEAIEIMRELGCTRVEIGVQTIDDKILKLIKRGHDVEAIKKATALLKNHGFKVDYHLMPQLPGSTPIKDLKMMKEIFSNPAFRPDMIKIYPCAVIANTELANWIKTKRYRPYSNKKLIEIIKKIKTSLPYYVRVSRLIRDIPSHHVLAGNKMTNLRQVIQSEMKRDGLKCKCLRCREIGHFNIQTLKYKNTKSLKATLFIEKYEASGGMEYFLSYEDKERNVIYAFCRLRIILSVWIHHAYIRELHTYGQQLSIGQKNNKDIQHRGLGKKLILEAEKICKKNKIDKLAVISGIGVRGYYRKLGYRLENGYMVKKILYKTLTTNG